MSTNLIVKDKIEIKASVEKVWEVLINPSFIKQWDDIPENYTGNHLKLGSVIEWEGYSKLTVVTFDNLKVLNLKMFLPKVNLEQSEYDVCYKYYLEHENNTTILTFEIGDFSPLPNAKNYFDTTNEWLVTAKHKIKELSEVSVDTSDASILNQIVAAEIEINVPADKIWDALINPAKIIQYTGSQLETTWEVDDNITWSGEMQGMPFVNKGKVLVFSPYSQLSFTYWSGMGGDADSPENYSTITYEINPVSDASCILKYNRSNIPTEMETQIFQSHIAFMLSEIRKISEQ